MALFLNNISLTDAQRIVVERCGELALKTEYVDTRYALGRITAEPVFAKISSPHFTAAAMDGIAARFKDTLDADINKPVLLKSDKFSFVDTGDPIDDEYDCVIMLEDIQKKDGGVLIRKPAVPYQNIRPIGEDMAMGAMIIPSNHKIRAIDISSLLAGGVNSIPVYENIIVGVIPTGDELIDVGMTPKKGELIDFNSWAFCSMIQEWGGQPKRYDIVRDDYEEIKDIIKKAVEKCHMVIINAGSAKGRGDFTGDILEETGEVLFHGISIKPGRPGSFAVIDGTPVFGVPGYPVSAYFVMESIVKMGFYSIQKSNMPTKNSVEAFVSRKVVSSLKNDEFIRVKLGRVGNKLIACPMGRGAGVTMSLTSSDGVFVIDKNREGVEAGDKVSVEVLKDLKSIDKTLVSIGSHDVLMDIIGDFMSKKGYDLSSTHVGSMGGIMALKRGETHIAPIHLLDENGEYNISYVKKYLGDYVIVKLVKRIQGLMIKKGNPLEIKSFNDLTRVRYVNRQKGAGTRLLLDYYLKKYGIDKESINGYGREEITHLTVATQIAGGSADCGMGVLSAAQYMGLDFIELCSEEYDIAFHPDILNDKRFKAFYEIIISQEFKNKLLEIGGYDTSDTGRIIDLKQVEYF